MARGKVALQLMSHVEHSRAPYTRPSSASCAPESGDDRCCRHDLALSRGTARPGYIAIGAISCTCLYYSLTLRLPTPLSSLAITSSTQRHRLTQRLNIPPITRAPALTSHNNINTSNCRPFINDWRP